MAATVQINETNRPNATKVETPAISNINFGSLDSPNLDPNANPISISGAPQSFEKWVRLAVTAMGGTAVVDNIRVWLSSGAFVTGEQLLSNLTVYSNSYSAATYPTAGPVNTVSAVAINAIPESIPVQANIGIGGQLAGQITSAPAYSDYIVLQLKVTAQTPAGAVNQKVITFELDEQ